MPRHPLDLLWRATSRVAPYPRGVIPVPTPIPGTAFFPGGYGLWRPEPARPLPPLPIGQVMVLAQDFHSEAGYHVSFNRGTELPHVATWRVLLPILREVGLDPSSCFFTNVYLGLRTGSLATGPFPGLKDPGFVQRCRAFLLGQLDLQTPRLVVTLGRPAFEALASLTPDLVDWMSADGFKALDQLGPVRSPVAIPGARRFCTTVVALLHPSLRVASLRHRAWDGQVAHAAEAAMFRKAITLAGLDAA